MFNHAKNGQIAIDGTSVSYITFGKGDKNLIMIPGVGEGLKTIKGYAIPFSILYKKYANDYKVYLFSRRDKLPEGFTTEDMANDIIRHMETLNIDKADIMGVSQGGMIAQYVAINAPDKVNKLVLVVTVPRPNKILEDSVNNWLEMSKNKEFKRIMVDTAEKSYVGKYLDRSRKIYGLLGIYGKKATFDRFNVEANACLSHNSYNKLNQIKCPTFIIGAKQDKALGIEGSKELNEGITNSELYVYEEYSHGVYEQAKDFNDRVLSFLKK